MGKGGAVENSPPQTGDGRGRGVLRKGAAGRVPEREVKVAEEPGGAARSCHAAALVARRNVRALNPALRRAVQRHVHVAGLRARHCEHQRGVEDLGGRRRRRRVSNKEERLEGK